MSTSTQNTIRKLASDAPNRTAFFQQFMAFVVHQTGAVSAIAWNSHSLPYRPIGQIQSPNHDVLKIGFNETEHLDLLHQAAGQDQAMVVSPKATNDSSEFKESSIENPWIIFCSIRGDDSSELIELFFAQGAERHIYDEHARFLESYCQTAAACEMNHAPSPTTPNITTPDREATAKRISPSQLDEYVHQIHRSLEPGETAKQIANEARRVLDCDRVSVVEIKANRCKVTAISGQPSVNNRSNTVQLLRRVCDRVLPTRQSFWYPTEKQIPPEIETPLQDYLATAATRSLIVVPVFDQPPQLDERPDPIESNPRLIGGLLIEHCSEEWSRDSVSNAIDIVTRHASDAFRNSYSHRQLLFYPVWKWLGKSSIVLAARNLSKTIAVAIGLAVLGLVLAFCPANLKVSCDGVLVPANRSNVFAPIEGTVAEIEVVHGSSVEAGTTLMRLTNLDLETQSAELAGKIRELERNIETTETLLLSRSLVEKQIGEQNLNAQKEELASYQRQQDLVQRKLEKLHITSPQSGQVVTWNLEERFAKRPVSRGDLLMEVVDVEGDWQLELNLPDQKIGHLLTAHANSADPLVVEFILAADPDHKLTGRLIDIGRSTEVEPDQGQTVRLKVKIDGHSLDIRQAKSGVTANVICGKTSLGNSLFMGVKEFCQKQWFQLF